MRGGDWTWLEVAKLLVGTLTSVAVFYLTYVTSESIRGEETASVRRSAAQEFSDDIFERRVRAELLSSSMKRHAREPIEETLAEVIRRKKEYDEAYVSWNRSGKSNLLTIREILGRDAYSNWDRIVDKHLVGRGFAPLDKCLTDGYDELIRGRDPGLSSCECVSRNGWRSRCTATQLIEFVLNCGVVLTDNLFAIAGEVPANQSADDVAKNIRKICSAP